MRCLLSRDGNRRKGEEGRSMGFCKSPSFLLCLEIKDIYGFHRLRGGAGRKPCPQPLVLCGGQWCFSAEGWKGVAASKLVSLEKDTDI